MRRLSFSTDTGFKQYVSGFASNMELQALFHINDVSDAMNLINTVWGEMITPGDNYSGADWEVIDLSGLPGFGSFTSLAHGWASGATPQVSSCVLGVRPVTPGYKTWVVQPQPGNLLTANGKPVWQSGRPIANTYKIEADSNFIYLNNMPGGNYRLESR
jgi:alpha-L-rhamnosidase